MKFRWFITKKMLVGLIGLLVAAMFLMALTGCGSRERAQAGADAMAGLKALRIKLATMEAGYATAEALAIIGGVEKYIPAATGVNPAEWPAARMSPERIAQTPQPYADNAPPIPPPSTDWWSVGEKILLVGLGLLTGTGGGMVVVRRVKTALRIACDLADQNAVAETDTDVERNKMIAAQQQALFGVQALTQQVRGKA